MPRRKKERKKDLKERLYWVIETDRQTDKADEKEKRERTEETKEKKNLKSKESEK